MSSSTKPPEPSSSGEGREARFDLRGGRQCGGGVPPAEAERPSSSTQASGCVSSSLHPGGSGASQTL